MKDDKLYLIHISESIDKIDSYTTGLDFASFMERLANEKSHRMEGFAWVSTHPVTSERVKRARNAATE